MSFDQNYVLDLLAGGARESRTLEYKSDFYEHGGKGNHELCKDVSAFANTNGGLIIIGVREEEDLPIIEGVESSEIGDQILRMNSTLVSKLDPRLGHIDFHPITVEGKTILVIEIPASFQSPHRVNIDDKSWFYLRTSAQVQTMDTRQIREAVLRSGDIYAAAKSFRDFRVSKISRDEGHRMLSGRIKLIIHVFPISEQGKIYLYSATDFPASFKAQGEEEHFEYRFLTFDGAIYAYSYPSTRTNQYVQIYRTGTIESVHSFNVQQKGFLNPKYVSTVFIRDTKAAIDQCKSYHQGDIMVMLTVMGVEGLTFTFSMVSTAGFDRDLMCLPEILISDQDTSLQVIRAKVMPVLNLLYQAAGNSGDIPEM